MTNEDNRPAVVGQVEPSVRPRAWMTRESAARLKLGGNSKGAVPVHQERSAIAVLPVYDQAAIDALRARVAELEDAMRHVMEFRGAEKAPTVHNWERWRRISDGTGA